MAKSVWAYRLAELPDPAYPSYRLLAGGDVRAALWADATHLLRALAEFPPNSVTVAIRFFFRPATKREDPLERLSVYVLGRACTEETALALSLLLRQAPFRRFCRLAPVDSDAIDWRTFRAGCDVVRRQTILEPTVTAESNPGALDAYLTVDSFQANRVNDYLLLDSLLGQIEEPVLAEICVGPTAIHDVLSMHTKYLAKVQLVNRTWDADEGDLPRHGLNTGSDWDLALKPLRIKDPLAEDVARRQRRFHETLTKPHLRFHFRVLAQTTAVARLVASVAADSAFKDGTYQLFDSADGEPFFDEAIKGEKDLRVVAMPALERLLNGRCVDLLDGLSSLASMAPVDQLTSAFRLPVASYDSPSCIRKNTDPPKESVGDLIMLGRDERSDSVVSEVPSGVVARGIPVQGLAKHLFVSGMPGSGKTTSIVHLLLQLSKRKIPFIVFEPAKGEYRLLKCMKGRKRRYVNRVATELQLYTPGNELISPFRLNPLRIPPGTSRDAHIENVLNCFKAAVPMFDPLPAIFGEALERVYGNEPETNAPPSMAEFNSMARRVLAAKRYAGEVDSNLKAALIRPGWAQWTPPTAQALAFGGNAAMIADASNTSMGVSATMAKNDRFTKKVILDRFGIAENTLRSWEEKGIISPAERDWRGWRWYGKQHLAQIEKHIANLKRKVERSAKQSK
ncbi:MAG: MerR family transcriptional regulator [Phycisphaerae bacterium]